LAGYIGEFEEVDNHRSGKIVVQLNGRYVHGGLQSCVCCRSDECLSG
jgi:ribosomal protein S8